MSSIWDDFRGHAEQVAMFRRAIGRGRLAQGYLFDRPMPAGQFSSRLQRAAIFKDNRFSDHAPLIIDYAL